MSEYIKKQIMLWDSLCKEQAEFYHRAAVWSGMSDAAYWVMFSVYENEQSVSQSELCAGNYFPKQTINSAVTKLLKLEFVKLESSSDSKKRKIIQLTPAGEVFCDQYVAPILKVEQASFEAFEREEIDRMLATMKRQLTIMKEKADEIWQ